MPNLFALALLAAAPRGPAIPDTSTAYFPGLARPRADQVALGRDGGPMILIVIDALRPDRISPYGSARDTTPNLAKLADDGLVLTNYFVNGNWTRPSTASLLTGLPPVAHGVERDQDRLADQFMTLAEVLGGAGVPTGAVVGNGNAGSAFGLGRGFDFYADTVRHWEGLPSAEQVVELAVPFVREHAAQPFFLLLFFVDPHDPYHAPGAYEDMWVQDPTVRLVRTPHWELGRYTPQEIERMKAVYDGAVTYTDAALGTFFEELRRLGLYDKSTILVTADHGEAFGEHGAFLHSHHFYDELVRAPLIVRAPRMQERGAYSPFLFQTIDLLPTVAGLYGIPLPRELPGVDIVAQLAEPEKNRADRFVISAFNNFGIRRRMIRTYREKVIFQEPADEATFLATVGKRSRLPSVSFGAERIELFDMVKDPLEKENLYSRELAEQPRWARLIRQIRAVKGKAHAQPSAPMVDVDPEVYKDLRSLGYIQ